MITGIAGQDGSYLAELLLEKGYEVHGLVRGRRAAGPQPGGGRTTWSLHQGDLADGARCARRCGGHSRTRSTTSLPSVHVPISWEQPVDSAETNALGVLRLLDAIVAAGCEARFFQASSSEIFGRSGGTPAGRVDPVATELALRRRQGLRAPPRRGYRRRHDLFACSGILFNHESPRRPANFVSRRVTAGAAAIKLGLADELPIGNLTARRDWGYAPEYMEAAWMMLQQPGPDDFVIGSGRSHTVAELAEAAFAVVGLEAEPVPATRSGGRALERRRVRPRRPGQGGRDGWAGRPAPGSTSWSRRW